MEQSLQGEKPPDPTAQSGAARVLMALLQGLWVLRHDPVSPQINKKQGQVHKLLQDGNKFPVRSFAGFELRFVVFPASLTCFWNDLVMQEGLQSAKPLCVLIW